MALNGKNKLKTCPIWNKNYTNYIDLYLKKEKTNSHKKWRYFCQLDENEG